MSGIVGFVNFDGQHGDERVLRRMLESIKHRGPDGLFATVKGTVALGHAAMRTTPEHAHEEQPLANEDASLRLVLDGRVDNREELRGALERKGAILRENTDAELVLKAYEAWGEECPGRIIGDFAFAIWDERSRQLYAARDTYSCRPFYYYADHKRFIFASEIQSVLAHPAVSSVINEGMLAEYLASALTSDEETLYAGVNRLPGAHYFVVKGSNIRRGRYWDVDPGSEIRYRSDDEYADHYRELLKECVRCRLRSDSPVGADLSGGMDSSSVVAVAMSLGGQGTDIRGFATYSVSFPGVSAADETSYIRDVIDFWKLDGTILEPGPRPLEWYIDQVERYRDHPEYPNGSYTDTTREAGRQRGHRVMLTGIGGDELFSGSYFHYADMIGKLQLGALLRQCRVDRMNHVLSVPRLLACGPRQFVPAFAKRLMRPFRSVPQPPVWIDPDFAARTNLVDRIRRPVVAPHFQSRVQRDMYETIASGWSVHAQDIDERSSAWFGVEQRHPFRDRRMVEFGFAVPETQRWRGAERKFIMRRGVRGLLPYSVINRSGKADLSYPFPVTMKKIDARGLLASAKLANMGAIVPEQVCTMLDDMTLRFDRNDPLYSNHMWTLWNLCGIELWLRNGVGASALS